MSQNKTATIWNRNFIFFTTGMELSVIAQGLLRFALPLYILRLTGDPAILGTVLSISVVSFILLSPFGGFITDRHSKRRMVFVLNGLSAAALLIYALSFSLGSIVITTIAILLFFQAIDAFLMPMNEAAFPFLVPEGTLTKANSITLLLNTFSAIGAPVLGGFLLGNYGLVPILWISIVLFLFAGFIQSAARIPMPKQEKKHSNLIKTVWCDFRDSARYLVHENRTMGKIILIMALYTMVLSPLLSVALPVLVTIHFGGGETIMGIIQGIVMAGGALSIILVNVLGNRLNIKKIRLLLMVCSLALVPTIPAFTLNGTSMISYVLMIASLFVVFGCLTIIGLLTWTFLGERTPENMLGKVIAFAMAMMGVGQGLGEFFYGLFFDQLVARPAIAFGIIAVAALGIALWANVKQRLE